MQIFITRNNEKLGPYTLQQVQTALQSGHLQANDMAWYEGVLNWMPLAQLPALANSNITMAAPPPPPQITNRSKTFNRNRTMPLLKRSLQ